MSKYFVFLYLLIFSDFVSSQDKWFDEEKTILHVVVKKYMESAEIKIGMTIDDFFEKNKDEYSVEKESCPGPYGGSGETCLIYSYVLRALSTYTCIPPYTPSSLHGDKPEECLLSVPHSDFAGVSFIFKEGILVSVTVDYKAVVTPPRY